MNLAAEDIDFSWLKENEHQHGLAVLTELIKKNQLAGTPGHSEYPTRSTGVLKLLKENKHHVRLAVHDNTVVGFTIYSKLQSDKSMQVLKTVIDPDYASEAVYDAVVKDMSYPLRPDCAHSMYYTVHVDDVGMQKALKKHGYVVPADSKHAIVQEHYPDGDSAVRLERHIVVPERTQLTVYKGPKNPLPEKPDNQRDLLRLMISKLELMTGVKWEAAMPNDSGTLEGQELTHMIAEKPALYLRTVLPVAHAQNAQNVLSGYFDKRVSKKIPVSADGADHVGVPASAVRTIHTWKAKEGQFVSAFAGGSEHDAASQSSSRFDSGRSL